MPEIIPALTWKHLSITPDRMLSMDKVEYLTIHHTNSNPLHPFSDQERLQYLLEYHVNNRAWSDIGYHFLISKSDIIYEGRKLEFQGAHVEGYNKGNIGIVLIGDYNIETLTDEASLALESLIKQLMERYSISSRKQIKGHRDFKGNLPGDCPGDFLYNWLENFRDAE